MKISTIIFSVVFSCMAFTAQSQFIKGQKLLGGSANINFISGKSSSPGYPTDKSHSSAIGVLPRFSWVTKENQMMGIVLGAQYSHNKSFKEDSPDYQASNNILLSAGYFFRQYKSFGGQAGWFMEYNVSGSYGRSTSTYLNAGVESKFKGKNYGGGILIYPGLYYKVSPRLLVEASFGGLNANYSKYTSATSSSSQFTIGASFPTNLSLGVQFFLGKKSVGK